MNDPPTALVGFGSEESHGLGGWWISYAFASTLPPYNFLAISAFHFSTLASCAMMAISFLWTPHVRFGSNQEQQAAQQSGS